MVKLYVRKIKAGEMTIEQVPMMWRDKVAAELDYIDVDVKIY